MFTIDTTDKYFEDFDHILESYDLAALAMRVHILTIAYRNGVAETERLYATEGEQPGLAEADEALSTAFKAGWAEIFADIPRDDLRVTESFVSYIVNTQAK